MVKLFKKPVFLLCMVLCMVLVLCSCQIGTDENQITALNQKYISSEQETESPDINKTTAPAAEKTPQKQKKTSGKSSPTENPPKKRTQKKNTAPEKTREPVESTTKEPGSSAPKTRQKKASAPTQKAQSRPKSTKTTARPKKAKTTARPEKAKTTARPETPKKTEIPEQEKTCSILIECTTILKNKENLKASKASFVPADGKILEKTDVAFEENDSVYDVLYRVCIENNIHIEAKYTPAYSTYYVEGINQLYEFDCGRLSGWMYLVNGQKPNYGCSSFKVSDGDSIVWSYTCNAGKDIQG